METYALDSNFNLVSIGIPYDNLQWTRKYYEAGQFQMQLPLKIYDSSWQYIGTNDRPELGMIQNVEISGEGETNVLISGFFCEKMLDDKACYPRYTGTATKTETAVRNIFSKFKKDLPITLASANNPLLGDKTDFDIVDDQLGEKIYSILESKELSYKVVYDYVDNKLQFKVWQGVDRTQSQTKNPYQVFSSEFGNITNKNVKLDESGYKNYAIIPIMDDGETVGADTLYLDWSNGGYRKEIVFDMRSSWPDEYTTDAEFKQQVLQQAAEMLQEYAVVEDIDINQADNSGYMKDYDLGDKCDVILTDIGVTMETRIVQIEEVFKASEGHSVTIGLGNKRLDNIRKAVRRR